MLGASTPLRHNNPLNVGAMPPASPHTTSSRESGFVLWIQLPKSWQLGLFVSAELVLTVAFEYYDTSVSMRWTYPELMPRVPPFGAGPSPLVQWIVISLLVVTLSARISRSSESEPRE